MTTFNSYGIPAAPRKVNDAGGVTLHAVVVQGTNEGEVKQPAAANAPKIIGSVQRLGPKNGANGDDVGVQVFGEAIFIAQAAIAVGDYVTTAVTNLTRVQTNAAAANTGNIVGIAQSAATAAGDQVRVLLTPGVLR